MTGIKSSLELAMERFKAAGDETRTLSAGQKARIAEVESEAQAKIAELELIMKPQLEQAQWEDNTQEADALEQDFRRRREDILAQAQAEKDEIRAE